MARASSPPHRTTPPGSGEAASGKPIGEPLRHEDTVSSAAYSPDGTRIVTASFDKTARQWEVASGKPIGEPLRHEDTVTSAAYSPDGTRIVTACRDHTARQWEAASGKPIGEPLHHESMVKSAVYCPDGTRIVTTCDDRTAWQWEGNFLSSPPPLWFDDLAAALSGFRFDEDAELQEVTVGERTRMQSVLLTSLQRSAAKPHSWEQLALWALSLPAERHDMPSSSQTNSDIAQRELATGQQADIEIALHLAPFLPLARLRLAAFEEDTVRADFLRHYDLQHLPPVATVRLTAVRLLEQQNQPQLAFELARSVTMAEPKNAEAWRQVVALLQFDFERRDEARQASETLAKLPDATADDISNAGLLCIEQKLVPRGRELLQEAAAKFPDDPSVYRCRGWGFIVLGSHDEALAAFEKSKALTKTSGQEPTSSLLAGLATTRWLTGDKAGAMAACQQLIAAQTAYADQQWVGCLPWIDAEKVPLIAAIAETLREHPELAPKPPTPP